MTHPIRASLANSESQARLVLDPTIVRSNGRLGMPFLAVAEYARLLCLCRAANRSDSVSLLRAQGTVGARSRPIPRSV